MFWILWKWIAQVENPRGGGWEGGGTAWATWVAVLTFVVSFGVILISVFVQQIYIFGISWAHQVHLEYLVDMFRTLCGGFPREIKNFHHWAAPNKSWYLSNSPPPPPPPPDVLLMNPPPIHWVSSNAVSTRNLLNKHYVGLFFPCSEAPCSFHEALFFNCDLLRCKWLFIVISVGTCNFCLVWQRSHRFKLQVRIPFRLLK